MNFGQAIEALKNGFSVQRAGWNGKAMSIFMVQGKQVSYEELMNSEARESILARNKAEGNLDNTPSTRYSHPYLVMITSDGGLVNEWLASQTDILAEDWQLVNG